ncbi:MAG TPA: hypothetical protein VLG76_04515 [Rhabdochlamydiaceae bacterium]|nr:hypothetical protein [Rhabdochlamydiaceae bacterium]
MIDNYNLNNTYSTLEAAKTSLEQSTKAALEKSDLFLGNFLGSQKAGIGVDATGICAGLAVYGYRQVYQLGPNDPLPVFPKRVPSEVTHLQMQLPRAVVHALPKGIDPSTVIRGTFDLFINMITRTFQRFIREEANVGIDAIFPGPKFDQYIQVKSGRKLKGFISFLFRRSGNNPEQSHFLFCLHKPKQTITQGHVLYVNLNQGIIIDAWFGPFIWRIDKIAIHHFENVLGHYLQKNYEEWNLFTCRVEQEPSTIYSKIPTFLRSNWTQSKMILTAAHKFGLKKACQLSSGLMLQTHVVKTVVNYFSKKKQLEKKFNEKLDTQNSSLSIEEMFKSYEKTALEYEQFSNVNFDKNCYLIPKWRFFKKEEWPDFFKALDNLDPRLQSLHSKLQEELLLKVYGIIKESRHWSYSPSEKKQMLEWAYSLAFELLERREKLTEKYSLDHLAKIIRIHSPDAEKLLEILLLYGASPD